MKKIIDESVLMDWQQFDSENWQTTVNAIVEVFLDVSASQYELLKLNWRKRDLVETKKVAHLLKSSFGNVGALRAGEMFQEIEMATDPQRIEVLMRELEPIVSETYTKLREFRTAIQAA